MKNFHLPLPEDVYVALRQEAERSKRPATSIALDAIKARLHDCRRAARHQVIAEFARDFAGTELDLDPQLEGAGIEHLLDLSPGLMTQVEK